MPIKDPFHFTRRKLLPQKAGITAYSVAMANLPRSLAESLADGRNGPPGTDLPISRRRAQILALDEVRLESGPYREAMERNSAYLLTLDPNRFLHFFHITAGLPPKADTYGGWEIKVGRMLGHYLSACSMHLRATGIPEFQQRQDYVVAELGACQRANGNGYVGGVPEANRIFHEIATGQIYIDRGGLNGVHAPWYMLHKMCAGLRDAYAYGGNQQALTVLTGFSDWT
jgi:hypothetical protein